MDQKPFAKMHGTKTLFPGCQDRRKIDDLISYLETLN